MMFQYDQHIVINNFVVVIVRIVMNTVIVITVIVIIVVVVVPTISINIIKNIPIPAAFVQV